ncbi:MAG: GIY-YIG nuclease family protein [Thermoplasmatales archaeon]|nr:GIY-YIG nuclease family protein [Thermoplasmatales archaeon]
MSGGTYALFFSLPNGFSGRVGSLGELSLPPGRYCYAGSAMASLDKRLGRHANPSKTMRWHIDYVTVRADGFAALASPGGAVAECSIAAAASEAGMTPAARGFGCSDCKCQTHLFNVPDGSWETLARVAGLRPYPVPAPKGY